MSTPTASGIAATNAELQQQREQAEQRYADLKRAFLAMERIVAALKDENARLQPQLAEMVRLVTALKDDNTRQQAKLMELERAKRALEVEATALREGCARLEAQLQALYESETYRYLARPVWKVLDRLKAIRRRMVAFFT